MKLLSLLKALRPDEHKEFEKFLQSPFFKASEQYLKFFKALCKHRPIFELDRAGLEAAYRRCFGQQAVPDSKLRNLYSGLSKQVELFLSVKVVVAPSHENGNRLQKELLVKSLGKRNMGAYFRGEAQRLIGEIEQLPVKSNHDYLSLKQLYEQVYYNADTPKYNISAQVLQSAIENLEMYYCIEKLRYAAESKSRERIFETRFDMPMLEAVIEKTAAPELEAMHPLAFIYNKLICLYIRGIKEEDFREMKLLFIKLFPLLPQEDQQLIIQQLINIGIWLTTKGYEVQPELFSLYKLCIKNKLLLSGNRITSSSFINIVNIAVFVKEFEWAKMFIADFSEYLEIGSQQTVISLVSADLFYAQGLLDNAQTSLIPETFMNSEFDIRARWLLLKIIFDRYLLEGKDYEFLRSILNAFEKFATLKKLAKERKNALLNSIRFVRKMVVLKFEMINVPEEKKGQLRKKLVEFKFVVSKKWLSEKIEAL